jgi:hypothetical protein
MLAIHPGACPAGRPAAKKSSFLDASRYTNELMGRKLRYGGTFAVTSSSKGGDHSIFFTFQEPTIMRPSFVIAVMLAALTVCSHLFAKDPSSERPAADHQAENSLVIIVELTAKSYKAGEPVQILCTLANNTPSELSIITHFIPEHHFIRFEISDPNGAKVPFNGPKVQLPMSWKKIVYLEPRTSYSKTLDITGATYSQRWYDLNTKGEYKLRAIWSIHEGWPASVERLMTECIAEKYRVNIDNLWTGEIISNEVTFRVE